MTGPVELHRRAADSFDRVIGLVGDSQWTLPTPCAEWDVRTLVNHVVGEALWTVPLLAGRTVAQVGDEFDGDVLGAVPRDAWAAARTAALSATDEDGVAERTVHLSFGDFPGAEYLRQLTADYLVHAWDLAVAIGADDTLDAELVADVAAWFAPVEAAYRAAGAIAERPAAPDTAQDRLLASFGRAAERERVLAAVARFGAAFDRQDLDAVLAAMTPDAVFENTAPPDGVRYAGADAVRGAFAEFFAASGGARFDTEERFASGDRAVVRWRYTWQASAAGPEGFVRGVDVFRVRDGLVAEKVSYVKG